MQIIVGLGNPGEKYIKTKHNIGFILLDVFSNSHNLEWQYEPRFDSLLAKHENLIFCKPQTFMNNSGESVSKLVSFHKLDLGDLIVIHDDVDLDFGDVKFGRKMGSAGHKGIDSIVEKLGGNDFWRLRVGIGRPIDTRFDVENYVLSDFTDEELEKMKTLWIKPTAFSFLAKMKNISIEEFMKQSRM